jgi:hypothetical protein
MTPVEITLALLLALSAVHAACKRSRQKKLDALACKEIDRKQEIISNNKLIIDDLTEKCNDRNVDIRALQDKFDKYRSSSERLANFLLSTADDVELQELVDSEFKTLRIVIPARWGTEEEFDAAHDDWYYRVTTGSALNNPARSEEREAMLKAAATPRHKLRESGDIVNAEATLFLNCGKDTKFGGMS